MSSIAVRRVFAVATCVLSFGALQGCEMTYLMMVRRALVSAACGASILLVTGCDNAGSAPAPLPAANLPADAPKGPVDSKTMIEKTKGNSSAAYDSTINTSLQKGAAPGK